MKKIYVKPDAEYLAMDIEDQVMATQLNGMVDSWGVGIGDELEKEY